MPTAAIGRYPHAASFAGEISLPEGIPLESVVVEPIIAAYRRMVRDLEFDICELAPVTYLLAKSRGLPVTALPVFLSRGFHHGDVVCRADAGIEQPTDLQGRAFGVRAYTVTTGVWVRGMLARRYGVDLEQVEWVVDDEDHVDIELPDNVTALPPGDAIADAFSRGRVHAALRGIAGVGRKGNPLQGWSESEIAVGGFETTDLFADAHAEARADFAETGVYPLHRAVVVKDEVVERFPELPELLFERFAEDKRRYLERLHDGSAGGDEEMAKHRQLVDIVGDDPLPYGLEANRATLEALVETTRAQGLLESDVDLDDAFYAFGDR